MNRPLGEEWNVILAGAREAELHFRSGLSSDYAPHAKSILRYGGFVGSSLEIFKSLPRAMDHARAMIDASEQRGQSVHNGHVIVSDTLSGSKGRFTRSWHAPQGGLWGCLVHVNTLLPRSTLLLSLAVGVAACETMQYYGAKGKNEALIRWVNDILIADKKVAGFLIESHVGPVWQEQYHLIGFGFNINNTAFPKELADSATSLQCVTGCQLNLQNVMSTFIAKLSWNIGLLYFFEAEHPEWAQGQDAAAEQLEHPVLSSWKSCTDTLGRQVVFGHDVVQQPQYRAQVIDIAPDGGLILRLVSGHQVVEYSGEIRYI